MSNPATNCECGRPLQAGEDRCPNCERTKQSFWKTIGGAGAIVVTVGVVVVKGVLFLVSRGET
jgi:hypothetical protein